MLKKIDSQDRPFLAALLLIAALLIAMGSFAENPQQPTANYAQAQSDGATPSKQPKSISFWQRTVREPINLFTAVLAIFTIILAAATIYQGMQTQKSVGIAQRALTDLERPVKCGWAYGVANGGKLPAVTKRVSGAIKFGRSIPPLQDQPAIHELLTAPLVVGGERRRVLQPLSDDGKPAHEHEIRGGKAMIPGTAFRTGGVVVRISIEYDGPLTNGHSTTVCLEWHPGMYAFAQYGGPEYNERT